MGFFFGALVGLVLGWTLFPRPAWAQPFLEALGSQVVKATDKSKEAIKVAVKPEGEK